jgi:hypothetical protein
VGQILDYLLLAVEAGRRPRYSGESIGLGEEDLAGLEGFESAALVVEGEVEELAEATVRGAMERADDGAAELFEVRLGELGVAHRPAVELAPDVIANEGGTEDLEHVRYGGERILRPAAGLVSDARP